MVFAAYRDNAYNLVLMLHILAVVVGAGASFVIPLVARKMRDASGSTAEAYGIVHDTALWLVAPGVILAGVFGGTLIGMSDKLFDFSQTWISVGSLLWLIASGLAVWLVLIQRQIADGTGDRGQLVKQTSMAAGILHLVLLFLIYVMVFRPGL